MNGGVSRDRKKNTEREREREYIKERETESKGDPYLDVGVPQG